ncbi:Ig domain-containing protein [Streptomyces sp. NPDC126514]|uniref:Ig domain-containing protein n=1 Tax=Streptomyces sp. NPDC126514 TaxID=3155210 RepID=UPI00331FC4B1
MDYNNLNFMSWEYYLPVLKTLLRPTGTPSQAQTPGSALDAAEQVRTAQADQLGRLGDTLQSVVFQNYTDWAAWEDGYILQWLAPFLTETGEDALLRQLDAVAGLTTQAALLSGAETQPSGEPPADGSTPADPTAVKNAQDAVIWTATELVIALQPIVEKWQQPQEWQQQDQSSPWPQIALPDSTFGPQGGGTWESASPADYLGQPQRAPEFSGAKIGKNRSATSSGPETAEQIHSGEAPTPLHAERPNIPSHLQLGQVYDVPLVASGGLPPYTWSVVGGAQKMLPKGLSLDPAGRIFGTPTPTPTEDKFVRCFSLKVRDSSKLEPQVVLMDDFTVRPPVASRVAPHPSLVFTDDPEIALHWQDDPDTSVLQARMTRSKLERIDDRFTKAIKTFELNIKKSFSKNPTENTFREWKSAAPIGEDVEISLQSQPLPPGETELQARVHVRIKLDKRKIQSESKRAVDEAGLGSLVGMYWFDDFFVVKGAVSGTAFQLLNMVAKGNGRIRRTKNFKRQSTYKIRAGGKANEIRVGEMIKSKWGVRVEPDDEK